jgi:hypothetical protein
MTSNRIDRNTHTNNLQLLSASSSPKKLQVKCACPGAVWGCVINREVVHRCVRVRTKCPRKTSIGLWVTPEILES